MSGATHEADLRIEPAPDPQALELHAVAIAGIVQLRAVAGVAAADALGLGPRPVGVDRQIVEEVERAVHAVCGVRSGATCPTRPVRGQRADAALPQDVALQRTTEKLVDSRCTTAARHFVGLDVQRADAVAAVASGQSAAAARSARAARLRGRSGGCRTAPARRRRPSSRRRR